MFVKPSIIELALFVLFVWTIASAPSSHRLTTRQAVSVKESERQYKETLQRIAERRAQMTKRQQDLRDHHTGTEMTP